MRKRNSYYKPRYTTSSGNSRYKIRNTSSRSYRRHIRRNDSSLVKLGFAALGIIGAIICIVVLIKSIIVAFKIATVYIGAMIAPIIITFVIIGTIAAMIFAFRFFRR